MKLRAVLLTLLASLGGPLGVVGQEVVPRQLHPEAEEAISKIRSPYCPGLMLEVCPTRSATFLRDSIDERARAGLEADSIIELVVAAHGEEYRAFPKRSGAGLLAWVMPPAALLLGLGVVVLVLGRLRRAEPADGDGGPATALTDEERDRLDEAMAELEAMEGME